MTTPDLIVCGSLTLDNVITSDGVTLPRTAGGNVVYAALGAMLWGHSVGLVSRAGADFPLDFLRMLGDRGLNLGGITRIDVPHGMNVAFAYRPDGSRVRAFPADIVAQIPIGQRARFIDYTTLGTAHRYATWIEFAPDAADVPEHWIQTMRGAHLAAMPVQRHASLIRRLRTARPGCHLQIDSPWYDERELDCDFHSALLSSINLLLPSEADLAAWRPSAAPLLAAGDLARQTGKPILVKRGNMGCLLIGANGEPAFAVPAYPVDAVDPTGAGDSFCGGVLAGLLLHGDLRRALVCGAVTASFTVEAAGIECLAHATREEAELRFDWLAERTSIF